MHVLHVGSDGLARPVVFWYVNPLCDAEHGGFEAVQRLLRGLLG